MTDPIVRFWRKVRKTPTCWYWDGWMTRTGYGLFGIRASHGVLAHRFAYECVHGPIPLGLQIDHLCHVRGCVNPDHLEAVTPQENVRRSARGNPQFCPRGHPYDEANTEWRPRSNCPAGRSRRCRICHREVQLKRYYRSSRATP
jgi:HNH endonuclease